MIRQSKKQSSNAVPSGEVAEHIVLYDVPWEAYEALLEAIGDRRLRHSYDDGTLEIMSPLKRHDRIKTLLARILEMTAFELDTDIQSIGSTTLRKQPRRKGLEPDECYYIAHEEAVRFEEDYDPNRDPPPDLAIEVDVTHSAVSRMDIYSELGVPEVWRVAGDKVTFYRHAKDGTYVKTSRSKAFPIVTPAVIEDFLGKRRQMSERQLLKEYVKWLRKEIGKRSS